MKIVNSPEIYRRWVPKTAHLYHQPDWLDIFSTSWSALAALDSEENPVWLWPYLRKARYGIHKYGRIPFCAGNGPLILNPEVRSVFDPSVVARSMSQWVVDDRDEVLDATQMATKGWITEDRYFQFFQLSDFPTDFRAMSRSKKKRMRKKHALEFVRIEDVEEAADIIIPFLVSQGWESMSAGDLRTWAAKLDRSFDHFLFGARDDAGHLQAVQWLVGHRQRLYGWLALRHPRYRDTNAREWLMWNIIQWARNRYAIYDLGGSVMPGVRSFNLEMGATELHFYRYTRYYPAALGRIRRYF